MEADCVLCFRSWSSGETRNNKIKGHLSAKWQSARCAVLNKVLLTPFSTTLNYYLLTDHRHDHQRGPQVCGDFILFYYITFWMIIEQLWASSSSFEVKKKGVFNHFCIIFSTLARYHQLAASLFSYYFVQKRYPVICISWPFMYIKTQKVQKDYQSKLYMSAMCTSLLDWTTKSKVVYFQLISEH